MPELPDVVAYLDALRPRVVGARLRRVQVRSPFLVRSVAPPLDDVVGRVCGDVTRLGKRIVLVFEGDYFLAIHLMIAGRLMWKAPEAKPTGRVDQAALNFDTGALVVIEASPKKRAALHAVAGWEALRALSPPGLDVLRATAAQFADRLRLENRTLKRALTSPRLFDGIGNAYSDEILHAARLSPFQRTQSLTDAEAYRLHEAARDTLESWIARLRELFDGGRRFPGPGEITAFRPGFAVHGKFGRPCPVCAAPVQRIVFAENEMNYCARCQTNGRVLADRSLSRLLRDDWPKTVEELEGGN